MQGRRTPTRQWHRYLIAVFAVLTLGSLLVIAGSAFVGSSTGASIQSNGYHIDDVNQTMTGELEDVEITTTADWEYNVDNADVRSVHLVAGPSENETDRISYMVDSGVPDEDSGVTEFEASLFDSDTLDKDEFAPGVDETETTEVVVGIGIEVRTENGAEMELYEYETVTVSLTDEGELDGEISGSGSLTVVESDD